MNIYLERFYIGEDCTLGHIDLDVARLFVLEQPWRDNMHDASCIPPGKYLLRPRTRQSGKVIIDVLDVPDRSYIEFHPGNTIRDTKGCLLPGLRWGLTPQPYVGGSGDAFDILLRLVSDAKEPVYLVVGIYGPFRSSDVGLM